jgi:hypothetical protein
MDVWLGRFRRFWSGRLDALERELIDPSAARRNTP